MDLSRGTNRTGRERVLKKEIKVKQLQGEPIFGNPGVVSWVRKNSDESFQEGERGTLGPWDPVPRLIQMFVSNPNQRPASIVLLS